MILQNGNITPGHLAKWITDGVIADAGFFPTPGETVLGQFISADFNTTNDQQIALPAWATKVALTRILITNANVSLTTAVGGFYPQTGKGGTALVANTQVYSALTTDSGLLACTLASYAQNNAFTSSILSNWSVFFSLTTPQGSGARADIFIAGIVLGVL